MFYSKSSRTKKVKNRMENIINKLKREREIKNINYGDDYSFYSQTVKDASTVSVYLDLEEKVGNFDDLCYNKTKKILEEEKQRDDPQQSIDY